MSKKIRKITKVIPTDLEEKLEAVRYDVGLIIADVQRGRASSAVEQRVAELKSAVLGMQSVINDLSDLRSSASQAIRAFYRLDTPAPLA